jgi:hypothetical protein
VLLSVKTVSDETRAKLSVAHLGKKHTDEAKAKIDAAQSGENNHRFGKPLPDETCAKISASTRGENNHHCGKPLSDEHRAKLGAANAARPSCITCHKQMSAKPFATCKRCAAKDA